MKHTKPLILFLTLAIVVPALLLLRSRSAPAAPATTRAQITFYGEIATPSFEEMDKAIRAIRIFQNTPRYKFMDAHAYHYYININAIYQDTVIFDTGSFVILDAGNAVSTREATLKINLKTGSILSLNITGDEFWEPDDFTTNAKNDAGKPHEPPIDPFAPTAASASPPKVYFNEDFGIKLPIPANTWLLPPSSNGIDHGPVLKLEKPKDDKPLDVDYDHDRYIEIFAGAQVDETAGLSDFFKSVTTFKNGEPELFPPPDGVSIPNLKYKAALILWPFGSVQVVLVTQAGEPNPSAYPNIPSVNYIFKLNTQARYLEDDLKPFREILKTVRLNPPPPTIAAQQKNAGAKQDKNAAPMPAVRLEIPSYSISK